MRHRFSYTIKPTTTSLKEQYEYNAQLTGAFTILPQLTLDKPASGSQCTIDLKDR